MNAAFLWNWEPRHDAPERRRPASPYKYRKNRRERQEKNAAGGTGLF
jgi:hypothetical protein